MINDQITPESEAYPLPFIYTELQRIGWGGYSTDYKEIPISRHFQYAQNQVHSIRWNEMSCNEGLSPYHIVHR